jgi:hypothetical protein
MLLSALAFAAALQTTAPADTAQSVGTLRMPPVRTPSMVAEQRRLTKERLLEARKASAPNKGAPWCGSTGFERVAKVEQQEAKRLGDLPMANHTLTVLRLENGCPVSSTVRFNVGR